MQIVGILAAVQSFLAVGLSVFIHIDRALCAANYLDGLRHLVQMRDFEQFPALRAAHPSVCRAAVKQVAVAAAGTFGKNLHRPIIRIMRKLKQLFLTHIYLRDGQVRCSSVTANVICIREEPLLGSNYEFALSRYNELWELPIQH